MSKNWLKDHTILLYISVGFLVVIVSTLITFVAMNKQVEKENQQLLQDVSNLYVSSIAQQTVTHEQMYFEGRFELLEQIIDSASALDDKESALDYLDKQLAEGLTSIVLIGEDSSIEAIRGDSGIRLYGGKDLNSALSEGENKVVLIADADGTKKAAMVVPRSFMLGNKKYKGLLCGFSVDTLNTVFNLSYNPENLTYSFVIQKEDSAFVVRNEGAFRTTYFDRIRALYRPYNDLTPDDYIHHITEAMEKNETHTDVFLMNDGLRMLYATPLQYSDWYLLTFIRYDEINNVLGDNNTRSDTVFTKYTGILVAVNLIVFACYAILSYIQIQKIKKSEQKALYASRAKSDFLANMSHDIRTPMNAIIGMTEIARLHIDDTARVENCLDKIALSGQHLVFLINDILDMSKIENEKMTLTISQASLSESLKSIVMIAQPQIKKKHHNFDIFTENINCENVYCDSLRLNQILINLVTNAIKYTPDNGDISLTVTQEASPKGDDYVRTHFIVRDNGIGMSEEFVKVIFNSFVREDRKRITKEEGSGLGLTITKFLIDAMDGTIDIESKLNEGSTFHVILDLKKCTESDEEMRLDNLNILIVDDNEDQCISIKETLDTLGAKAQYALNGNGAIEAVKNASAKFDIIMIDWLMPGLNGVETSAKIRELAGDDTPIILVSAYDYSEIEDNVNSPLINGFLPKPMLKSTLYYGIKQHLSKSDIKAKSETRSGSFSGERILLAEDNELNGEIAIEILTDAGLTVDWAKNGKECVDKFLASEEGWYKAILMDIRMPIMNGYEATVEIRALQRSDSDIPIIAATADAFTEEVAKAKACGMNEHIAKPIDTNQLIATLKKYR